MANHGDMGDMGDMAITHISEVTSCSDLGVLHIGDKVQVKVTYNTTLHPLNPNHEGGMGGGHDHQKFAPVMGINLLYLSLERKSVS